MVWEHPGRVALQVHVFHDIAKVFLSNQVPSGWQDRNKLWRKDLQGFKEKKEKRRKILFQTLLEGG